MYWSLSRPRSRQFLSLIQKKTLFTRRCKENWIMIWFYPFGSAQCRGQGCDQGGICGYKVARVVLNFKLHVIRAAKVITSIWSLNKIKIKLVQEHPNRCRRNGLASAPLYFVSTVCYIGRYVQQRSNNDNEEDEKPNFPNHNNIILFQLSVCDKAGLAAWRWKCVRRWLLWWCKMVNRHWRSRERKQVVAWIMGRTNKDTIIG